MYEVGWKRQYDQLLKNDEEEYVCHMCDINTAGTVQEQLQRMDTKLNKLDQLAESMHFMSAKFDELMNGITANRRKIDTVQKENLKLKNEVNTLKETVKMLNDQRVRNDCVISGVTASEGKSAVEAVIELSETVGVNIVKENIDEAYFLKKKNLPNQNQSLIVKFNTKSAKN